MQLVAVAHLHHRVWALTLLFVQIERVHVDAANNAHPISDPFPQEVLRARRSLLLELLAERRQATDPIEALPIVADELVLDEVHHGIDRGLELFLVHRGSLTVTEGGGFTVESKGARAIEVLWWPLGLDVVADPNGHFMRRAPCS